MIKRINLIQKKAFSFTYQMLLQVCLAVVLINALFVGLQVYRTDSMQKEKIQLDAEVRKLESQRDELMKKPNKTKISVGQFQELFDRIENTPKWSKVLDDLSQRLPNTVWITFFKTDTAAPAAAADSSKKISKSFRDRDKSKAAPPPEQTAVVQKNHFVELSGMSSDAKNITEFTTNLSRSEFFKGLTLSESGKQSFGYEFKIKAEINLNVE